MSDQNREHGANQLLAGFISWLTQPWMLVCLTFLAFAAMNHGLGLRYVPTELDLNVQEKLMLVQQSRGLIDHDAVSRLDNLLQQNGWVDEIIH
ncbi:MAG: hypothetical protein ACKO85_14855 [Isosphaeraceae bacterium]